MSRKVLTFITWNSGEKSITESLESELIDRRTNKLLTINEASFGLADLTRLGLIGVMHDNPRCKGLSVYISVSLQHYSSYWFSRWTIYGSIHLPKVGDLEALTIGFISFYRSPSLSVDENIDFFVDLEETAKLLKSTCDLTYVMGDLNGNEFRICNETGGQLAAYPERRAIYRSFMKALPAEVHHHYEAVLLKRPCRHTGVQTRACESRRVHVHGRFARACGFL